MEYIRIFGHRHPGDDLTVVSVLNEVAAVLHQ